MVREGEQIMGKNMEIGGFHDRTIGTMGILRPGGILHNFVGKRYRSASIRMGDTNPATIGFKHQSPGSPDQTNFPQGVKKPGFPPGLVIITNIGNLPVIRSKVHADFQGGKGIHAAFYDFIFQPIRVLLSAGKVQEERCRQQGCGISGPGVFHR
jgi:hypothetical protein